MPARKRHRRQPEHPDPIVRFNRALNDRKQRERERQNRVRAEREEAQRQARLAAEHAAQLAAARRDVERSIAEIKRARASGTSTAAADEAWKSAKARVIELETGRSPDWG